MMSRDDIDATATAAADLDETAPEGSDEPPMHETADDLDGDLEHDQPVSLDSKLGRYVLLREIGAGAIGVVYAAYHEGLDRKLAIKVLNRRRAGRADLEARLRREAKALAKLSHPNVVQVYDVGEFDGRVFVAMEFVEGETLTQWMQRQHTLAEKLEMFVAAGRGLAAAHEAGVIHRDFKPDNVLVGADGRPRVLDFGLARASERPPKPSPVEAQTRSGSGPLIASLAQLLHTGPTSGARSGRTRTSSPVQTKEPPPPSPAEACNPATVDPGRSEAVDEFATITTRDEQRSIETKLDHDPELAVTILSEPGSRIPIDIDGAGLTDDVVTRDGAMLGTPAYMPPEQFLGRKVDHASDQFSFCVALYEAVYGHRPFAGKTTMELLVQTQEGRVVDPPPGSEVPSWLRQILVRGLSPRPADRYESMHALLAELEHDPREARRGRWLTAVAVVIVAGLAFVVGVVAPKQAPACPQLDAVADELWPSARAEQLRAAFERSPLPYARAAWTATRQRLDDWTQVWAAQRIEACEATHVRQEFSSEVLDLRQACLDRGRRAFEALTEQFASGETGVIERAIEAVAALPDPRRCGDVNSLLTGVKPPPEAVASRVGELREQLAEIETLITTGRWQQGLARSAEALDQARETGHGPVIAEALLVRGRMQAESGAGSDALASLEDALDEAERSGHDELVPRIATELVSLSIYTRPDPIRGRIWARRSIAALDRVDERGHARARGIWALGNLERLDGDNTAAEAHLREALALLDEAAPDHPDRAIMLNDLGNALEAQGRYQEARETHELALQRSIEAFGPGHPRVGHAHYNLARVAFAEDRFAPAREQLELARRIYTEAHGPRHRDVGSVELLAANIAIAAGEIDEAALHARRVKDIYASELAPDNVDRAEPDLLLGHIAFFREEHDQAIAHYRSCLAVQRAALPAGHISMALTLTNLGLVHLVRGDHDAAVENLDEALAILEAGAAVNPDELRMGQKYLGDALLARARAGDLRRAIALFEAAFEGCSGAPVCAEIALQAAHAHTRSGNAEAAARWTGVAER